MKKLLTTVLLCVALITLVVAYSTYGAPSEFGNETTTTCWVGGDNGIVNCTGDGSFEGEFNVAENVTASWFKGRFNWTQTDGWGSFDGSELLFNETKLAIIYYNANSSQAVAGTISGTLNLTYHLDGDYDGVTFNFTEASGSPGLDLRVNFTSIPDFSSGLMRYYTSNLKGDYPVIQLWSYTDSEWEDYPIVSESASFKTIVQGVFDSSEHISGEVVQMRIYKSANGNTNNHYYIDWLAISKGYGTPSGNEVDPSSWHRDNGGSESGSFTTTGNVTANQFNSTGDQWCNQTNCYTLAELLNDTDTTYSNLSEFIDDLGDRGYTHLSNFTDDLGYVNDTDTTYTAGSNLTLTDTTFSLNTTAVSEWLDLIYLKIADVVGLVGNWSADKSNYYNKTYVYNKTEIDNFDFTTNASALSYVNSTGLIINWSGVGDTDTTNHSELTNLNWSVAGHIMDAILDMNTHKITNVVNPENDQDAMTLKYMTDYLAGYVVDVGATAPLTTTGGTAPSISTSMNTDKLIGRGTAGAGVMEEITLGTGLSLTATTLNADTGIWTNVSGTATYDDDFNVTKANEISMFTDDGILYVRRYVT